MNRIIASSIAAGLLAVSAQAAIIDFYLTGTAGDGLLSGNEPQPLAFPTNGSGGEINGTTTGFGIFYDDVSNQLTVNVGWGSGNGFNDLSSNVVDQHIHGPVASNFGNGFTETTGVRFQLVRSSASPSSGTIVDNVVTLTAADETALFNGRFYVNVHTANNGGGEARGFLVQVPEPSAGLLAMLGALGMVWRRKKRVA